MRIRLIFLLTLIGWCAGLSRADGAGQTSATYTVVADVFNSASPGLAAGSTDYQTTRSVQEQALIGRQTGAVSRVADLGFQAALGGLDTDYDGTPDHLDTDSDNDGIADGADARPYDTDNDGENNFSDDDDDGDYLADTVESGYGTSWADPDTDDDGQTDYEEAEVVQTDPVNSNDYLRCTQVQHPGGAIEVTWASTDGVTNYWMQRSTNLTDGSSWVDIAGPLSGAAGTNRTSHTDTSPPQPAHYRVYVPYTIP